MVDELLLGNVRKDPSVVVDLVGGDAPFGGFGIEFNAQDDTTFLQDESFVWIVEGGKQQIDFGGQIHVCLEISLFVALSGVTTMKLSRVRCRY